MQYPKFEINKPAGNKFIQWHWGWHIGLAGLLVFTIAVRYALPIRDGDIWFHLLYAKYFLEHHTLISDHTIYSWTPATGDTIYCAWISELFFYLLYSVGKLPLLYAFRYLCVLIFCAVVLHTAKHLKLLKHPFTWVICLQGVCSSYAAIFAKPEIFSYVFISLAAWNWWYIRWGKQPTLMNCYFFPLLMLVWVNSHGAFIFGCIFYFLIGAGELLNGVLCPAHKLTKKIRFHFFVSLVLSALSIFITPYGWKYPYQLLNKLFLAGTSNYGSFVAAHQTTFSQEGPFLSLGELADIQVVLLVILLIVNLRRKNIEWSLLLSNFGFALLYTFFLRTTYFWAPIFSVSALQLLSTAPFFTSPPKIIQRYAVGLTALALGLFLSVSTIYDAKCNPESYLWFGFGISESNPIEPADFIKENYPHAKIGNTYNEGAYLMWRLYPENKIFFDARHFPYKEWTEEFHTFMAGKNVTSFLTKYQADIWCVGITYRNLLNWFLSSPEWQPVFAGKTAVVFSKKKTASLQQPDIVFSENILAPKNATVALRFFTFLVNLQEWQKAQQLLEYMEINFTCPTRQEDSLSPLQHFFNGAFAYHNKEYEKAAQSLRKVKGINCSRMLAFSLLHSAATYWEKGDNKKAFELNEMAWSYAPGNLYSLYNGGIITWHYEKNKKTADANTALSNPPNWHDLLQAFLKVAPQTPQYNSSIAIAHMILAGTVSDKTRPVLLVPPDPETKNTAAAEHQK
jgi:tetratricopeptide (TPR) repeat protein